MQDPWAHQAFGDPNAFKPPAAPGPSREPSRRVARTSWDNFLESLHWVVGAFLVGAIAMWILLWGRNYRRSTEDAESMERERATFTQKLTKANAETKASAEKMEQEWATFTQKLTKANAETKASAEKMEQEWATFTQKLTKANAETKAELTEANAELTKANTALQRQVDSFKPPATGGGAKAQKQYEAVARYVAEWELLIHGEGEDWKESKESKGRMAFLEGVVRKQLLQKGEDPTQYDLRGIVERAFELAGKKIR